MGLPERVCGEGSNAAQRADLVAQPALVPMVFAVGCEVVDYRFAEIVLSLIERQDCKWRRRIRVQPSANH